MYLYGHTYTIIINVLAGIYKIIGRSERPGNLGKIWEAYVSIYIYPSPERAKQQSFSSSIAMAEDDLVGLSGFDQSKPDPVQIYSGSGCIA